MQRGAADQFKNVGCGGGTNKTGGLTPLRSARLSSIHQSLLPVERWTLDLVLAASRRCLPAVSASTAASAMMSFPHRCIQCTAVVAHGQLARNSRSVVGTPAQKWSGPTYELGTPSQRGRSAALQERSPGFHERPYKGWLSSRPATESSKERGHLASALQQMVVHLSHAKPDRVPNAAVSTAIWAA